MQRPSIISVKRLPLRDAIVAHELIEKAEVQGKIVMSMEENRPFKDSHGPSL
jgi:hypothetical protein